MDFRRTMQAAARSPWGWTLAFFLLAAALKWRTIGRPPAWDEADSIFSAADWLGAHHFNIAGMLRDPGCGAHWFSLMSLVTAAVISLCGHQAGWALLHITQWAMGAAAGAVFMRMLAPLWGRGTAFAAALLFLLAPVTLGQLGCMYAEIPLALFSVGAVAAHLQGRRGLALSLCCLACFTKESGLLAAAALGGAALIESETRLKGVLRAFFYWAPAAAVTLATSSAGTGGTGAAPAFGWLWLAGRFDAACAAVSGTLSVVWHYLPDHIVLLAACLLPAALALGKALRTPRAHRGGASPEARLALVASLFIAGFVLLFWAVVAVAWDNPNYLPRYLVQALPFIIILGLHALRPLCHPGVLAAGLAMLAAGAIVNRRGLLYPTVPTKELFNAAVLAERSEEWEDWQDVARASLAAAGREVPPDVPLLCGRTMHVLARNPALGYVSKPLPATVWILKAPAYRGAPTAMPPRFYLLDDHSNRGGELIGYLIRQCGQPGFPLKVRSEQVFSRGMFSFRLVEIVRKEAGPTAASPQEAGRR